MEILTATIILSCVAKTRLHPTCEAYKLYIQSINTFGFVVHIVEKFDISNENYYHIELAESHLVFS